MIHNIRKISFVIQESPHDPLIPAVIPRAIDMIRNSCRPLGVIWPVQPWLDQFGSSTDMLMQFDFNSLHPTVIVVTKHLLQLHNSILI